MPGAAPSLPQPDLLHQALPAEVRALLDAARDLASTLELRPLLDLLLDHLGRVVEYSGTAILSLNEAGDTLTFAHMRGPASFTWEEASRIRYAIADFHAHWEVLTRDEPIVMPDIRGEGDAARTFCRMVGEN